MNAGRKAAVLVTATLVWGAAPAVAQANGQGSPQEKVGVCHRTASETNPYVYIYVPKDEANGHITGTDKQHNTKVYWKSDGTWRGVPHHAGDEKLDYYADGPADCEDTASTTTTTTGTQTQTVPPTTGETSSTTSQPSTTSATSSSSTTSTTSSGTTSTTSTTSSPSTTTTESSTSTTSTAPTTGTSSSSSTTPITRTYSGTVRPSTTTHTSSGSVPTTTGPGSTSGSPGTPPSSEGGPTRGLLAYTGYDTTLTLVWGLMLLLLGIASIAACRRCFAVERHH